MATATEQQITFNPITSSGQSYTYNPYQPRVVIPGEVSPGYPAPEPKPTGADTTLPVLKKACGSGCGAGANAPTGPGIGSNPFAPISPTLNLGASGASGAETMCTEAEKRSNLFIILAAFAIGYVLGKR